MANELKIVTATPLGEEQGYIDCETDLEIGEENDFEMRMSLDDWDKSKLDYDFRILCVRNRIRWFSGRYVRTDKKQ